MNTFVTQFITCIYFLYFSKILTNERCYMCNIFSHWLRSSWVSTRPQPMTEDVTFVKHTLIGWNLAMFDSNKSPINFSVVNWHIDGLLLCHCYRHPRWGLLNYKPINFSIRCISDFAKLFVTSLNPDHIDGSVQKRYNSIANTLELQLFFIKPSISCSCQKVVWKK